MKGNRNLVILLLSASLVGGCVTSRADKPFLTTRAFERATQRCHVVSQGVRRARGSAVPYGIYKIAGATGEARSDQGQARICMTDALARYRFDFLGEEMAKDEQ